MRAFKALLCRSLLVCFSLTGTFLAQAQLTANFSATPVSGCAPLLVAFTDLSTGTPTSWKWDLGNGTISFLQNPTATYFTPGFYNIKLVVYTASGADSVVKVNHINVQAQPTVNFNGLPLSGCFPLPVTFTDQSSAGTGTIGTWEWDFGDGFLSSSQNPVHTYTASGNYNVSLRITNSFGCSKTLTKPGYIQINPGVLASFTNTIPNTCTAPATINFQNTSAGVGLTYKWDFGDGGTSLLTNPSHTYTTPGSFTVMLISISNMGCTDTVIKANAITVGTVAADFTMPSSICQAGTFTITNTSNPTPASVTWDFGDGTSGTGMNPGKSYAVPGTYNVKMVANFGACLDSITKPITVLAAAAIAFAADKTTGCKPPVIVNFSQSIPGATSYFWDFGDGFTSTSPNPSHTYNAYGAYTVKLKVTNASGCIDSLIKADYIRVQAPVVGIAGLPFTGCVPATYNFSGAINSVDPVTSYLWSFGDGTTSTAANPAHSFTIPGSYTVSLFITTAGGCSDSIVVNAGVVVGTKPSANFSANPVEVCPLQTVDFSDLSTGNPDQWLWDFGDGGTSTDQNPSYQYSDTGYVNVRLIVWNRGCPDTIDFTRYIHINPPIANFARVIDCTDPFTKMFTDNSIGADSWHWDFGDGSTSTQQHGSHTYADTGTYTVRLTVTNAASGCSHYKELTVFVIHEIANFTASDTIICKGLPVSFTATGNVSNKVYLYKWDFGDGGSTTTLTTSVKHTYVQSGRYTVMLSVVDILGCADTLIRPLYIRVDGPTTDFSTPTPGICVNGTVIFNDISATDGLHPIQEWIWDFGDGGTLTATAPPFQHQYTTPGQYNVSLKIKDSQGCLDSLIKPLYITVAKPIAQFTADSISCTSGPIQFINLSTGNLVNYTWNFGDGNTSNAPAPTHTYASEGTYTVTLTIVDQFGCTDTIVKPAFILIANARADFAMSDSLSTCPPLVVTFTNSSTNTLTKTWNFGDGTTSTLDNPTHFYSVSGVYNVVLTVTGPGGCVDTKTRQIIVRGPQGSFSYSNFVGCSPLTTNFIASTRDNLSFIWDFNDGTVTSNFDSAMSHTYSIAGTYLPKIILVDSGGCQVPIIGIDTIRVYNINADFTLSATAICDSGFVAFNSTSITNDGIASYFWDFGDGTTSIQPNPVHQYNSTGAYITKLIVSTNNGCRDTMVHSSPIKIVGSPVIGINSANGACIPATFNFSGQVMVPDTSSLTWAWDFGNGNLSSGQNPAGQAYPVAGSYNIKLVATNSSGCKDSIAKSVQAYPLPVITSIPDTVLCKGQAINLNAGGAVSYTWSPALGLSCINCPNPVATPDSATTFVVQGTSANGCIGRDSIAMTVRLPFKMIVGKGDTLCKGEAARLNITNASTYIWTPSLGLNDPTSPTPVATPLLSTIYRVVGTDDKGCFKDTAYIPVTVYPYPVVNAGADKTIPVGSTIDLIPTYSSDVTSVNWSPTSGIFRSNPPAITVKPNNTTEYTVEATNPGGCISRDKVSVMVVCDNANVYLPNTFSPNGDGVNDMFYLRGSGLFTVRSFRVFNRWGEMVFEKTLVNPNDISFGWDGKHKGIALPPDVFVYTAEVICNNNTPLIFKGNVALIK